MAKKVLILFLTLIITSCAPDIVKRTNNSGGVSYSDKVRAQSLFIDGSILELKGEFSQAVELYLEALKYDPRPGLDYTIAKNYYRLNKLFAALDYSNRAVRKDSSNIEFLMLNATVYSASHMNDSAEAVFGKIIRLDSNNVNAYYNLAQLCEPQKPGLAISYYKKVIELTGPEWNILTRIADLNERLGNVNETVKTVEELLKLNPSELSLQKLLIDSYIKIKSYDKALALLDEAQISFPDDTNLIEMRGSLYVQRGLWKEASAEYLKLVKNPKINFENKLRIGTAFYLQGEKDSLSYDYAKDIFEEINKDSLDWQTNAYLGEIDLHKGNYPSAIDYFKVAARLAEWNAQIWVRLGGLLFDAGRYKEAIEYMSQASEKFPNDFAVNLIYGLSLSSDNQHLKAKDALQRALNINPEDVTALSALGFTCNQLKEDDQALVHLEKALKYDPQNLQVISIIALIHESRKDYTVSDSLYSAAVKIDPSNVLILNNFAYSLSERGIRLEEALSMAKKAIEKEPENSSYLDTIGWIYFKLGEYKKAKTNIEQAIKLEDTNATLLDHLGDVYSKMGNRSKAVENWKKAFDMDPTKNELLKKIEKGEL